jgi:hypothetical protein
MSGSQCGKKFYLRAHAGGGEVRGVSVVYGQTMHAAMQPAVVAMSNAFTPFPAAVQAAGPPPRPKVEYSTGLVITREGHLVVDADATDGCQFIVVSGHGNADLVAEDRGAGLALLRLYGAGKLVEASFASQGPRDGEAALVGIADPQAQAGQSAVSAASVRIVTVGGARSVEPPPAAGFAGAAVMSQNAVAGTARLAPAVVVGGTPPVPRATLVPVDGPRFPAGARAANPGGRNAGRRRRGAADHLRQEIDRADTASGQ